MFWVPRALLKRYCLYYKFSPSALSICGQTAGRVLFSSGMSHWTIFRVLFPFLLFRFFSHFFRWDKNSHGHVFRHTWEFMLLRRLCLCVSTSFSDWLLLIIFSLLHTQFVFPTVLDDTCWKIHVKLVSFVLEHGSFFPTGNSAISDK